ncbi:MAG TPA: phage tail length tape measure family protein, partial [Pyrinomonadaceae bacterium]
MPEILEVELHISEGNAEVVLGKSKKSLEDFVQIAEKAQPEIKLKISNGSFIDLDKLEEKAAETRKAFAGIAAQRLDSGQVGMLTKEIVRASERSRQLSGEIAAIKRALADPTRKSSIAVLTEELKAAEREADQLNRKLNSLPSGDGRPSAPSRGTAPGGGGNVKLSGFQKQNLSYQINDVLTGLASGQNPSQILAQQGGQIAQIFEPAQIAAFTAKYASLVTVLGAGAAAIALTYKITGDMRAEAERLLKVEEQITSAKNNQILASKKLREELQKSRDEAEEDRRYQSTLDRGATVEDLIKRRENLQRLQNLTPETLPTVENNKLVQKENETFTRNAEQLKRYDADIYALREKREKAAAEAFNNRFKLETKSQESEFKAQERAIKAQEKFNKSVEDGKKKVDELGKKYSSTFDDLFARSQKENPFVSVFSEGEKALKSLRENLKGLDADLQAKAVSVQQKINSNALFETRLDNNLSIFDLRERARAFRNPQESAEQRQNRIDDGARRHVEAGNFFVGGAFGNYGSYLANKAGGFDKLTAEQKRDIYEVRSFGNLGYLGNPQNSTFNELNANSLERSLASDRLRDADKNLSLNERLQKQLAIIDGSGGSEAERAIAGRKFLALTSGVDPSQLNGNLRERAALENEREADRKSKYETDLLATQKEALAIQKRREEVEKEMLDIVKKQGVEGLKV